VKKVSYLILSLIGLLTAPTLAWWDVGHTLVAQIAEQHLQKSTRNEVDWILAHHPDPSVRTLSDAAVWPDRIKDPHHPFHHEDRSHWHYRNRAVGTPRKATEDSGALLEQIPLQLALLSDKNRPLAQRAIALCWVVHLVGDIHQPLHNATCFSEKFPTGDRGGNDYNVIVGASPLSLHMLWDSVGGRFIEPPSAARLRSYVQWFQQRHPKSSLSPEASVLSIQTWSDEGLEIAESDIYPHLTPGEKIPNEQLQSTLDITKRQICLAGYRLATTLNQNL